MFVQSNMMYDQTTNRSFKTDAIGNTTQRSIKGYPTSKTKYPKTEIVFLTEGGKPVVHSGPKNMQERTKHKERRKVSEDAHSLNKATS